jgi:hypothetical protein
VSADVHPVSVLKGSDLVRESRSVEDGLLAVLEFSILDEAADNGSGRDPVSRSVMIRVVPYAISQDNYSYDIIVKKPSNTASLWLRRRNA